MTEIKQSFQGIIKDLSNEDYHACSALGSSTIKKHRQSLAHVKAAIDGELDNGDQQARFDLGTVAHSLCLEQDTSKFVCGPDVSSKAVKAWKEFVEANPDKIVLSPKEYKSLLALFEKYCAHPFASKIIDRAVVEESHFAIDTQTGLWLKARPDAFIAESNFIVDYKTASSARPRDFAKAIFNFGYDISAAHYSEVVEQTTGLAVDMFFWVVQEIKAPYEIVVFRASKELLTRAKAERRNILNDIRLCTERNKWPGYSQEVQEIDIPAYLIGELEPEFV